MCVYRAHMLDAAKQHVPPRKEYEAFDDIRDIAEAKHSDGKTSEDDVS